MSISTKTGDSGETRLWTGEKVGKDEDRVEAYGSLDELSSFLGLARHDCGLPETKASIEGLQRDLLRACSELASPGPRREGFLAREDEAAMTEAVHSLEARIPLKGFVLPGMTKGSAALDVARTVCRRAERRIVALSRSAPVSPELLSWVNRLSDYLFMLARSEEAAQGAITYAK